MGRSPTASLLLAATLMFCMSFDIAVAQSFQPTAEQMRMINQLPPAQREAIYLRHFAGCSFAEIGRATGVPTFTAASRYRLGLQRLRRLVGVEP